MTLTAQASAGRQLLDEIMQKLGVMPPEEKAALAKLAFEGTSHLLWVPNPGVQTQAVDCEADELFFGGSSGGGKSDLMIGLSLTGHRKSLILRRTNKEAAKLFDRYLEMLGSRDGWNGQDSTWRLAGGRVIDISGCQLEEDRQKFKGAPHDLIGFDEVSDFTESQFTFITIWNRSVDPNQRCRVIAAGNPPTTPEGLWVIKYWAPWLDPTHPNPAKAGELRWFLGGQEVEDRGPYTVEGKKVFARSRTFIPAKLADNPDLAATNYDSVLAGLPEELRLAYREGRFDVSLKDGAFQTIPTSWIRAAQVRWKPETPHGIPMCAMGVDVAQGGSDQTILAPRYDGWFPPLIAIPGAKTPFGKDVAGAVISHRRGNAKVIIDMGGGYGGAAFEHLRDNLGNDAVVGYKGAQNATGRTADGQLAFFNRRSQAYWRFREALDPSQPQGSPIMLPEDPELVADLTAPSFRVGPRGVQVEAKEDVVKRLGRSCDRGDAVVMAWIEGAKMATHFHEWRADQRPMSVRADQGFKRTGIQVNLGPRRR